MAPFIGEFDVDPDSIPIAPEVPENTDIVLEIVKAERKAFPQETGPDASCISIQVKPVEFPGSGLAFTSLWISGQYRAAKPEKDAHRSLVNFLIITKLPFTTTANNLPGVRFVGQVRPNRKNADFLDVSKVVGAV